MTAPHKSDCPGRTGQFADNQNSDTAIVSPPGDGCNAKLTASLIAAFALTGFAVHRLEGESFLVSRWNLTKHCPDLRTLLAFAKQVGARC
jgi:hypothetical protein